MTPSLALSKIRKLTGDHMVMSKATSARTRSAWSRSTSPTSTSPATRSRTSGRQHEGFGLTYLPFIARAVIDGLDEFPHLNASVGDDDLVVHNFIDLGIAVDLDYEGLLAPVIRDAETKRLRPSPARSTTSPIGPARRKLSPDEISGGTFTIYQQRLGRLGAHHADHQPAAGGDHLDRRDRPQAGRRHRPPTAARPSPSTRSATWP